MLLSAATRAAGRCCSCRGSSSLLAALAAASRRRPLLVGRSSLACAAAAKAGKVGGSGGGGGRKTPRKSKSEQQELEEDFERSSELLGAAELDIDALLNNEAAMSALRSKLLSEMAAAQAAAQQHTAASSASARPGQQQQQQAVQVRLPASHQHHAAFDSDEFDLAALDEDASSSLDELAQEAASKLAAESQDIAQHIMQEHLQDHLVDDEAAAMRSASRGWSQGSSSSSGGSGQARSRGGLASVQPQGGKQPVPAPPPRQQQQQQQRSSSSSSSSSRGSSELSGKGSDRAGSPGSSGGAGRQQQQRQPRKLAGDTAIGRVAEARPGGVPVVVLKKGKARLFEAGSPMVYGGAVDCVIGSPQPGPGDAVVVADASMQPLAWGLFNAASMFRVRIMQTEAEAIAAASDAAVLDVPALVELRVGQALALRAALGLPSQDTNAFRLLNSEGDRLSGVVADWLGDVIVVQSCAAWSERYRATIEAALQRQTGVSRIVWRPAAGILKEEGIDLAASSSSSEAQPSSRGSSEGEKAAASPLASLADSDAGALEAAAAAASGRAEAGPGPASSSTSNEGKSGGGRASWLAHAMRVREAGLTFLATPEAGQKTGFYADQRLNRAFVASLAPGRTVLDLCCYSGGFGLAAAAAGAAAVTGVDSSAAAVELASANAALNGLQDRCAFVKDDVSTFLRAAIEAGQVFDLVVLDPPKLAPNKKSLARASSKYRRLNALAMGVVRPGGLLVTCSCSGAMTQAGDLPRVVAEAAGDAERQVTLLAKAGAAPDHPLHPAYPEGAYLTALTYLVL